MALKKGRSLRENERFTEVVNQYAGGYKTIGQMVYSVLREAITSGAFAPGEWLRQESLAEAIGASRIPVRTALLQLEAEGLVTFNPHSGARVRMLSAEQIEEIYRLRVLLECHALRLSMARMRPERLQRMRELADQLDNEPEGGDFLNTRVAFYRETYDAENNPLLVQVIEELRGHVGRYLLGFRAALHEHTHGELVEHIARGDLTSAESWLRGHLEVVRARIADLAREASEDGDEGEDGDDEATDSPPSAHGATGADRTDAAKPRKQRAKAADASKIAAIR